MEWIYAIAALASALATALAWAAKLQWSKEFKDAKDEIIRAKEAHIELLKNELQNLRDLTPMKIREYFISVRQQLEEYNSELQEKLQKAREESEAKNREIQKLLSEGNTHSPDLKRLQAEKEEIEGEKASYTHQLLFAKEVASGQTVIEKLLMQAVSEPENLEKLREFTRSEIIQIMDKPLDQRIQHARILFDEVRKLKAE
jgi:hypothetical protein